MAYHRHQDPTVTRALCLADLSADGTGRDRCARQAGHFGPHKTEIYGYVVCPGCLRRGARIPVTVRRGYQCGTCADIEEGAY